MSALLRKMMSVYMNEEAGGEGGGGGGDSTAEAAILAKAEADKTASEAADKIATDAKAAADKSKVTDAEAKLLKEVMDKKTALKKTNDELAALKETMKGLEELGGVDALKALAIQKKDLESKKLEEQGEWSRLKQQMNDEHGKILNEKLEQLSAANTDKQKLLDQISELTVGSAFTTSEFIRNGLVLPLNKVKVLYGGHFEFKDGAVVGYDKPAGTAERTMLVDAKGDVLNFELAMAKIIDADPERDYLLKSKIKGGAGSSTYKKATDAKELDKPHGQDRISAALAKGALKKA